MRLLILIVLFSLLIGNSHAQEPPVPIPSIAAAFHVAEDSLRVAEKTEEVATKYGENIVSAFLVDSADAKFPSIQILVTKGRFLLSKELEEKFLNAQNGVDTKQLPDGSSAYISVEGVGPGGEGHVGLAHLKSLDRDLKVKVTIKNDDLHMAELNEGFREILASGDSLNAVITSMMVSASEVLLKNPTKSAEAKKSQPTPEAVYPPIEENRAETPARQDLARMNDPVLEAESGSKRTGIILLLVISMFMLSVATWKMFSGKK